MKRRSAIALTARAVATPTFSAAQALTPITIAGGRRVDHARSFDFIEKNRVTVNAFARAMREASAYVDAHSAEAIPLLARFSGTDAARIAQMHHSTYAIPASFDARTMIAAGF